MDPQQVVVAAPRSDFVELSRTKRGRVFRKHILNKGDLIHPVTKAHIAIDDEFIAALTANFNAGVCDIVQIPLAGDKNEHSEAPDRNLGEIVGIEQQGDKVYALMDVRKEDMADELGSTLIGASAMMNLNYTDSRTGRKVGPTLLHVAVTNRPYITNLEGYEEILAASSDSSGETVLLTQASPPVSKPDIEDEPMDLETLLTTLRVEHNIDVRRLQAQVQAAAPAIALSTALSSALLDSGMVELSAGQEGASNDAILSAISTLAQDNVELTAAAEELQTRANEVLVDTYVTGGFILPAQRDAMLQLCATNRELFDSLVPDEPLVKLSNEGGYDTSDSNGKLDVDAEIERLVNAHVHAATPQK